MSYNKRIVPYLPFGMEYTVLIGYRGSLAHGTYVHGKTDDIDLMAITMTPEEYIVGLKRFDQKQVQEDEIDLVVYEFQKYLRLLLKSNPNVLSLLWLKDNHYIHRTKTGDALIANRDIFISQACYKTFGGYAANQLRRMNKSEYRGYMGKERKAMVDKVGYDTKHAAHCIRLLKMGIEILKTGEVIVERPDAQKYIAIKNGEWPVEKVIEEAERLDALLDETYTRSEIPKKPDYHAAEALCVQLTKEYYGWD